MNQSQLTAETYRVVDDIVRVANTAVDLAQQESRRLGVPNVYSVHGQIYYETSAGELTLADPFGKEERAE